MHARPTNHLVTVQWRAPCGMMGWRVGVRACTDSVGESTQAEARDLDCTQLPATIEVLGLLTVKLRKREREMTPLFQPTTEG